MDDELMSYIYIWEGKQKVSYLIDKLPDEQ